MNRPIRIELPTVYENMTVNSWLFLEPEPTLVDCGEKTDKAWNALNIALKRYGLTVADIKKLILTHGHVDHMGMANKIVQHSDATVYVNEYLYDWAVDLKTMLDRRSSAISEVMKPILPDHLLRYYFEFGYEALSPIWEEIPKDRIEIFKVDDQLSFGNANWQVIYTPGHCINQTCFYNPENGFLLSADMLLRMIPVPIIDADLAPPYRPVQSLVIQLDSYDRLKDLTIREVFPGHFESFENAHELITAQVQKIHKRKNHCLQLIETGITNIEELTNHIYPGRMNQATLFMVVGFLDILKKEGLS